MNYIKKLNLPYKKYMVIYDYFKKCKYYDGKLRIEWDDVSKMLHELYKEGK